MAQTGMRAREWLRKGVAGARAAGAIAVATAGLVGAARAAEPELASSWVVEQSSRTRVVAGEAALPGQEKRIYAGLEIQLDDGWKTYWRNPGSSGVPPRVDFEGSENLAKAELLFPAPHRFIDRDGDTIGYKKWVLLPLALTAKDPSKPIVLKVSAEFGICREVCVPVQPTLSLEVPRSAPVLDPSAGLAQALAKVPQANARGPDAPRVVRVTTTLTGAKPQVTIDAVFPGSSDGADVFLEAPEGIWIPLPKAAGAANDGARRFIVDLADGVDLNDLKGKSIRMTLVGAKGQSETTFDLVEAR
ncbi:MAG: hypothetical protein JSS20_01640 [Proteobacteria bacterium]|nr:hypothetical protein [Pseudomonadota bacterium]